MMRNTLQLKKIFWPYWLFLYSLSDPDLAINVDLGREEEEKNGRRKYSDKCIITPK